MNKNYLINDVYVSECKFYRELKKCIRRRECYRPYYYDDDLKDGVLYTMTNDQIEQEVKTEYKYYKKSFIKDVKNKPKYTIPYGLTYFVPIEEMDKLTVEQDYYITDDEIQMMLFRSCFNYALYWNARNEVRYTKHNTNLDTFIRYLESDCFILANKNLTEIVLRLENLLKQGDCRKEIETCL